MAHDVFISYSTNDKTVADAVCGTLESRGIRCWIAPRDIPPGKSWPAAIVEAISNSKVFVLVFSNGSNQSRQVFNEVGEAFDNEIPIVPFRIEDVEPSQEMGYFIKTTHWLDAMNPPLERDLNDLAKSVKAFLSVDEEEETLQREIITPFPLQKRAAMPLWTKVAIGSIPLLVLISALIWNVFRPRPNAPPAFLEPAGRTGTRAARDALSTESSAPIEATPDSPWSDWRLLSFNTPNDIDWDQIGEDKYIAHTGIQGDTFAWSEEVIEGDLILDLEIGSTDSKASGTIIIYGDGAGFSEGNLIFTLSEGIFWVEKHTPYHEGENFLAVYESELDFQGQVFLTTIEIIDDKASFIVDGEKVISFFIPDEIERTGRIGITQHWEEPDDRIYTNIKIKTSEFPSPKIISAGSSTAEPKQTSEASSDSDWNDWRELTFEIPNQDLWTASGDGSYTALDQNEQDTFAWSNEIIAGDFILNLDITSEDDYFLAHIIAYGDAMGFSDGNLIFLIGDENVIKKHSVYIDEELTFLAGNNADLVDKGQTYNATIEVVDGKASLFIDDQKVVSATLDDEVNVKGKIGFFKNWNAESVTFSNIRIKTKNEGE